MAREIVIQAPYELQREIEDDPTRFRVISCGRRWGKTYMAMREAFKMLVRAYQVHNRKARGWVIAPTFPLVREDWLTAEELLKEAITDKKLTDMRMNFGEFGFIEFKSADKGSDGLLGAGLDFAVLDEAKLIPKEAWEQGIRPALADKRGRAIFISTPKGRNFFYELFLKGRKNESDWKSWQHPSYTNPYFPRDEWLSIQRTTPEMILKQEYLADFLEDSASVFKNIERCFRGMLEEPKNEYYAIGVDLGRTEDFTVITVIKNSACQVVDLYRMNKVDWSLQKEMIKSICNKYKKSIVYIDSTGLGDPIEEDLRKSGINTKDYKFSNASKEKLVEQLIVAIEQGLIGIPNVPKTQFLIDELKSFTYELSASGNIKYTAPSGLHDDGVISLGLAVMGVSHLFYKNNKPKEVKPTGQMTADDWDRFYDSIDYEQKFNPFLTREQAREKQRTRFIRRALIGAR